MRAVTREEPEAIARLLWLVPLSVLLHNLEEYPRIVDYARRHGVTVPRRQMGIAVGLATLAPLPIVALAARNPRERRPLEAALAIAALMVVNAGTHLGQTVALRDYSPGTVTGLAFNVPLAVALFRRVAAARLLSKAELRRAALLGGLGMAPAVLVLHAFAWLVDRRVSRRG